MTFRLPDIACLMYYFNSHAHVERDVVADYVNWAKKHFNSHAHVERDQTAFQVLAVKANFNSHAHVERDISTLLNLIC